MFQRMSVRWVAIPLLALSACATASDAPVGPSASAVRRDLADVVELQVAAGFSGVVLVADGDRFLLSDGFGALAGSAVKRDSRFWIASTGKQFTSAAVMKLVDVGRLRLDDPLIHFFPETPADKADISVRQLLSHTSGLGQSYVSEGQTSRDAAVKLMLAEPLAAKPGEGFRYSNSNFQLAAAIVEIVSGGSYADFVQTELWRPARLSDTGFAGRAESKTVSPTTDELPERLRASFWGEQGVYSSAHDLFLWYRALRSGAIVEPGDVQSLFAPAARIGEGYSALGWFTGVSPGGQDLIFTRGNEDFGANSLLYAYPDRDIVIIVLTHAGYADGEWSWSRKIHRELEAALGL